MEHRNEKARAELHAERERLFAFTPWEVEKLTHAEQYQRMRYEREIEGNEYVFLLKKGFARQEAADQAIKNADRIVANWPTHHGSDAS